MTEEIDDNAYSQPFFTDTEEHCNNYVVKGHTRKRPCNNDYLEDSSQSLLSPLPTKCSKYGTYKAVQPSSLHINNSTQVKKKSHEVVKEYNVEAQNKSEPEDNKSHEPDEEKDILSNNNTSNCYYCFHQNSLDKRNFYFGNLLIGELQFLPPCMRSEAYMHILKYVDSLKQQHRRSN